jgi:four helix bundle protein
MDNRSGSWTCRPFIYSLLCLGSGLRFATPPCMAFPFEDLEVYKRSINLCTQIETIIDRNGVSKTIADQLSRAALSIPLNIAEGNGRWHSGDKRQFFWIARGSAFECIPIIEILSIKSVISLKERDEIRSKLQIIGKMLTRLSQAHEKQKERI